MTTPISLTYRGDGAIRPGLPARDIDGAELASIALTRKVDVDSVADEAIGSGLYLGVYAPGDEPVPGEEAVDRHTELARMTKAELRDVADGLALELPKAATNAALVDAIAAEEQRLADEAAASSDGEGDQGGSTPADDPGAVATGEAGQPPSSEVPPVA